MAARRVTKTTKELELEARIAKLEYEVSQGVGYQNKLEEDQTKILAALNSNIQNMDYLKMHEGIIDVAHIKVMKEAIHGLQILLSNSQRTIDDFEAGMAKQIKYLDNFKKELLKIQSKIGLVIDLDERRKNVKRRD